MSSVPVFQERYPHEAGFGSLFAREISPILWEIEQDREKSVTWFWVSLAIGLGVFAAPAIWLQPMLHSASENTRNTYIGILTLIVLGIFVCLTSIFMGYGSRAKGRIVPLITGFFPDLTYDAKNYLTPGITRPFGIVPSYDSYKGEDKFTQHQVFESSELRLTENRQVGNKRRTVTTFKGLALKFNLPRKVTAQVLVKPDGGMIGNWLSGFSSKKVSLEDPIFEKLFDVYSSDQIESRRVLQPALMLRMVQFAELMTNWGSDINKLPEGSRPGELPDADRLTAKGIKFSASFTDNALLMLVPCKKDLFQPGSLFTSAYNLNEMRCVLYQIHLIRLIADELKKFPQLVD